MIRHVYQIDNSLPAARHFDRLCEKKELLERRYDSAFSDLSSQYTSMGIVKLPREFKKIAPARKEEPWRFRWPRISFERSLTSVQPLSANAMVCRIVMLSLRPCCWTNATAARPQTVEVRGMVRTVTMLWIIRAALYHASLSRYN